MYVRWVQPQKEKDNTDIIVCSKPQYCMWAALIKPTWSDEMTGNELVVLKCKWCTQNSKGGEMCLSFELERGDRKLFDLKQQAVEKRENSEVLCQS